MENGFSARSQATHRLLATPHECMPNRRDWLRLSKPLFASADGLLVCHTVNIVGTKARLRPRPIQCVRQVPTQAIRHRHPNPKSNQPPAQTIGFSSIPVHSMFVFACRSPCVQSSNRFNRQDRLLFGRTSIFSSVMRDEPVLQTLDHQFLIGQATARRKLRFHAHV